MSANYSRLVCLHVEWLIGPDGDVCAACGEVRPARAGFLSDDPDFAERPLPRIPDFQAREAEREVRRQRVPSRG